MTYKYMVFSDNGAKCSNSRNARKHLLEMDAENVAVYDANMNVVCLAQRDYISGAILVGAVKGARG